MIHRFMQLLTMLVLTLIAPLWAHGEEANVVDNVDVELEFRHISEMKEGEVRWIMPYRCYTYYETRKDQDFKEFMVRLADDTPSAERKFRDERYCVDAVPITRLPAGGETDFAIDWTGCYWQFALDPFVEAESKVLFVGEDEGLWQLSWVPKKPYSFATIKVGKRTLSRLPTSEFMHNRLMEAQVYGPPKAGHVWVSARFLHFSKEEADYPGWIDAWAPYSLEKFTDDLGQAIKVTIAVKPGNASSVDQTWYASVDVLGVSHLWEKPLSWAETVKDERYNRLRFRDRQHPEGRKLVVLAWIYVAKFTGNVPRGDAASVARK